MMTAKERYTKAWRAARKRYHILRAMEAQEPGSFMLVLLEQQYDAAGVDVGGEIYTTAYSQLLHRNHYSYPVSFGNVSLNRKINSRRPGAFRAEMQYRRFHETYKKDRAS